MKTPGDRTPAGSEPGRPAQSRRSIPLPRRVLYSGLVGATALLTAELVLRALGFAPPPRQTLERRYDKFRADPDLIWTLAPSWSGFEPNGAPLRTNALGFRGREIDASSDSLILFLGDSVTFGHHLADGETIPDLLEAALNAGDPRRRLQVVNAAVPGYSTFQAEALFRKRGAALAPRLVLLGFCFNDVTERYLALAPFGGASTFMGVVDTTVGMSWPARVWRRTALRQALVRAMRGSASRAERYGLTQLWTEPEPEPIRQAWDTVFGEIDALAAAVREAGGRLAVVIYPYALQMLDPRYGDGPQRRLIAQLERRGILHLDLLPALRSADVPIETLYLDANHFTPRGARLVADHIAAFVRGGPGLGR